VRRRLLALAASAILHLAVALVSVLVTTRAGALPPLIIDLTAAADAMGEALGQALSPAARPVAPQGAERPARAPAPYSMLPSPASPPPEPILVTTPVAGAAPAPAPSPPGEPEPAVPAPARARSDPPSRPAEERAPVPVEAGAPTPMAEPAPSGRSSRVAPAPPDEPGEGSGIEPAGIPEPPAGASEPARAGSPSSAAGSPLTLAIPGDGRALTPPEYGPYLARLRQRVHEALRYPLAARRRGLSGKVELEVLIDAAGRVQQVEVVLSSSHVLLDEAAIDAVRFLPPLPFPRGVPARAVKVRLPLVFELR
jgi:TonB family protein